MITFKTRTFKLRCWHLKGKVFLNGDNVAAKVIPVNPVGNSFELIVDGIVIMQWTGLVDKNGREVYEGDILQWKPADHSDYDPKRERVLVKFENGSFISHWSSLNGESVEPISHTIEDGYFVIGNMFENPELLDEN